MKKLIGWVLRVTVVAFALVAIAVSTAYVYRYALFRRVLELPPYSHAAGGVRYLTVRMRDGIRLQTQVHLPAGGKSFPTVLIRNPYNFADVFGFVCGAFARYGYACVHQDVRGRMGSEGEWVPLVHERDDGIDTLAWLTEQPFQDGHIALYGMSYLAAVQWSVADVLPPEVKTLIPMVFGTDAYQTHYRGGMYRLEVFTAWAAFMPDASMRFDHADAYAAAVRHRPHREVDEKFFGRRLPWYRDWIQSPNRTDPLWRSEEFSAFRKMPEQTEIPVLMLGGWYDFFLPAQLDDFNRLRSRARSRLVIGPWNHLQRSLHDEGADIGLGGQWRQVLNWLDHHLRGGKLDGPTGVVQTYVYGEDRWRTHREFPPSGTSSRTFALSDLERSPTCAGGRLAPPSETSQAGVVEYRYDPDDPVPADGGANTLAFAFRTFDAVRPGPVTLRQVCDRPDVLTFVSAPLSTPVPLAGAATVELNVSSDAPDTAFTAKLIEVDADGRAVHVRDSIRALTYRSDLEGPPVPYAPGSTARLRIVLSPIEWTFPAGSRVRLDVSSSNFPVYHAHPNRYGVWSEHTGADVATNRVHGGSRLILPVLEAGGRPGFDEKTDAGR